MISYKNESSTEFELRHPFGIEIARIGLRGSYEFEPTGHDEYAGEI